MRSILVLLALCAGIWTSAASADAKLVELAVFSCPYCKGLQPHTTTLSKRLGSDFIFAPVAERTAGAYTVRAYYALRDRLDNRTLANALFDLVQTMRMNPRTPTDVLQWLKYQGLDFDAARIRRQMMGPAVNAAMKRARLLVSVAGVRYVPAMVLIDNGRVIGSWRLLDNQSNRDFINTVLTAWEKHHESN